MKAPGRSRAGAPRQVFRQRGPVIMSILFGSVGGLMLYSAAESWSTDPNPAFVAWLLFSLGVVWAVFARPSVVLDHRGVHLNNIVRDITVPWSLVDDVEARWNVKVWVDGQTYTAWAISSAVDRDKVPPSGIASVTTRFGESTKNAGEIKPIKGAITARKVADAIILTRVEYDDAVEKGLLVPEADARVQLGWVVPSILGMALPMVAGLLLAFG